MPLSVLLQRLHQVEKELIDERTSHDATQELLRLARQQLDTLASPARSQHTAGGSGGRTPAAVAAAAAAGAPGTSTATARKRQATATPGDSAGQAALQNGGVGADGTEGTARKTGGARGSKRQRVRQQEPDAMEEDTGGSGGCVS